jgi:EF hand domain-containing protein
LLRFFAGIAACFLLMTGAFLIWQSRAAPGPALPSAPEPRAFSASMVAASPSLEAPEASPKSREQKRFSRADKDKDGKIESEELLGSRRKAFAKLDTNGNGALSFDEWAVKTITKFKGADKDRSGWLTAAEYATTAAPPPKHKSCSCGTNYASRRTDNADD